MFFYCIEGTHLVVPTIKIVLANQQKPNLKPGINYAIPVLILISI